MSGRFARILRDDIRALPEASVESGGFVIDTPEASIWRFLNTDNYRDAVLLAVNLGDDTDTTAVVTSAMAGLLHSEIRPSKKTPYKGSIPIGYPSGSAYDRMSVDICSSMTRRIYKKV
jgi:hypothetical protein